MNIIFVALVHLSLSFCSNSLSLNPHLTQVTAPLEEGGGGTFEQAQDHIPSLITMVLHARVSLGLIDRWF